MMYTFLGKFLQGETNKNLLKKLLQNKDPFFVTFKQDARKNKKYFDISTNNGHEGTNNGMKLYGIPLPTSHQMNKAAKL